MGSLCSASVEPGRRPIARGRDEASEEAVYQSSPQLARLLRSEFTALVVGYADPLRILAKSDVKVALELVGPLCALFPRGTPFIWGNDGF